MARMLAGTLSGGSRSLAPTTWGCHPGRNLGVSLAKHSPGALVPFDAHGSLAAAAASIYVCCVIPKTLGSSYEHIRPGLWQQTCTTLAQDAMRPPTESLLEGEAMTGERSQASKHRIRTLLKGGHSAPLRAVFSGCRSKKRRSKGVSLYKTFETELEIADDAKDQGKKNAQSS